MVMLLPVPGADCLTLIDAVVAERTKEPNKSFFQSIAAEWKVRVGVYIAHGGSPAQVQTWPAAEAKGGAFKNLYSHPAENSAQGAMLEALRGHDLDICPACGSPTPGNAGPLSAEGAISAIRDHPGQSDPNVRSLPATEEGKNGERCVAALFHSSLFRRLLIAPDRAVGHCRALCSTDFQPDAASRSDR